MRWPSGSFLSGGYQILLHGRLLCILVKIEVNVREVMTEPEAGV